jgi:acyl-CoA thioesterase-1
MIKKFKTVAFIAAIVVLMLIMAGFETMQNKGDQNIVRVACVGDSLTEGSEYPLNLWMLLGNNYTVGTFGQGGTTVSLNATSYMDEEVFQVAKQSQPNIVIIMLGTNDALPRFHIYNNYFVDDYLTLIREFQTLQTKPQVWLVLPPPIWNNGTGLNTEFYDQHVIPNIREVANKTGLPTINLYSALTNRPDCFPDGVHPNSEGSQLIAQEVYKALTSKKS